MTEQYSTVQYSTVQYSTVQNRMKKTDNKNESAQQTLRYAHELQLGVGGGK